MTIDTLFMGDTAPGEYLKRGTGSDSDKIVSDAGPTGSGSGGSGSSPTDTIENSAQTADVKVNASEVIDANGSEFRIVRPGAALVLNQPSGGYHDLTVSDTPELLLNGIPVGGGPLQANPVEVHGQERLKDGVHQIYVQDQWVDQLTPEYWVNDKTPYMSIIPEDIDGWDNYEAAYVVNGSGYASPTPFSFLKHGNVQVWQLYIMLKHPMRIQGVSFRTNGSNNSSTSSIFNIKGSNDLATWDTIATIGDNKMFKHGDDGSEFGGKVFKYNTTDIGNTYRFLKIDNSTNTSTPITEIYDISVKAFGRSDADPISYSFNTFPRNYSNSAPSMSIFDGTNNDIAKLTSGHGFTSGLAWASSQTINSSTYIETGLDAPADISAACYFQSNDNTHGIWKFQYFDGTTYVDASSTFTLGGSRFQLIPFTSTVNTSNIRLTPLTAPGNNTGTPSDIHGIAFSEANKASYDYVGGDRSATWVLTSNVLLAQGVLSNLVNTYSTAQDTYFTNGQNALGKNITIEIPTALAMSVIRFRQSTTASHGDWDIETSTDGSTWVNRGTTITLGGDVDNVYPLTTDTTPYKYIRFNGVSGTTSSGPWLYDLDISVLN